MPEQTTKSATPAAGPTAHSELGRASFGFAAAAWALLGIEWFGFVHSNWYATSEFFQRVLPPEDGRRLTLLALIPGSLAVMGATLAFLIDIRIPRRHLFSNLGFVLSVILILLVVLLVLSFRSQ